MCEKIKGAYLMEKVVGTGGRHEKQEEGGTERERQRLSKYTDKRAGKQVPMDTVNIT